MELMSPSRYASEGYPWDEWRWLRREAPVKKFEREGVSDYWAITRHEDILAISQDPETYSSESGVRIDSKEDEVSLPTKYCLGPNMFGMDPPLHGQFRALTAAAFSPRRLKTKQTARRVCHEIFEAHFSNESGHCEVDFVHDVAVPLSVQTLADLLDLSEETTVLLSSSSESWRSQSRDETLIVRAQRRRDATNVLLEALVEEIERRDREPDDTDLISLLARCEVNGRPLDGPTLLSYCHSLAIAGTESTRHLIGETAKVFAEHPKQWDRLVEDPALIPTAVEELLRWISPVVHFARTVTKPTVLWGQSLEAGDQVALFYPSANRDEQVFNAPELFDVGRTPNRHLAFGGFGVHQCLGMNMARLELVALLEFLVTYVSAFSIVGPPKRFGSLLVGGYSYMPVRMHR